MDLYAVIAEALRSIDWLYLGIGAGVGTAAILVVHAYQSFRRWRTDWRVARGDLLPDEAIGLRMDLAEDPDPPDPPTLKNKLSQLAWSVAGLFGLAFWDALEGSQSAAIWIAAVLVGSWAVYRLWRFVNDPHSESGFAWPSFEVPEEATLGFAFAAGALVFFAIAAMVLL